MHIEIDKYSGFCFGVKKAINTAEQLLKNGEKIDCLGEIVHNKKEEGRLSKLGMGIVSLDTLNKQKNKTILIRSHGVPPSTYSTLKENGNKVIDATCPVVLKLQERIKKSFENIDNELWQLVIYGKPDHPEVVGLNGQANNKAIVITNIVGIEKLDLNRPIELYCQTTMPLDVFQDIKEEINRRAKSKVIIHDTICRQVANRVPHIKDFSSKHSIIFFVSGKKSSNGKLLYEVSKQNNTNSYFISSSSEINKEWFFPEIKSIGICGATSTPMWLMEEVKEYLEKLFNQRQ